MCHVAEENPWCYYGVIDGFFSNYNIEYVNAKAIIIELPTTKSSIMKNRIISPQAAKNIISNACSIWKQKLATKWGKDVVLGNKIEIEEEFYQTMRNACTKEQHMLFDSIFGKDEEFYPDGTPCLVRAKMGDTWSLRYADGKGSFYFNGTMNTSIGGKKWDYFMKLDMNNLPVVEE